MKKILILLFLMAPCFALDYSNYCSPQSASKSISGVISSVSGTSTIARLVAQKEIENALKKETNSKFKVKVNSFWGANLTKGEFSRFYAVSKNYSDKKLSAQKLTVETVCPYNKVSFENNKLNFDTNMVLKFNAEMNENDVSQLLKQKIQLENNKVILPVKISVFGVKTSFKVKAGLDIIDNKIKLCNIELNEKALNASKYAGLLNELMNFKVDLDKNKSADIKIDSIKIKNSLVYLSGFAFISKN